MTVIAEVVQCNLHRFSFWLPSCRDDQYCVNAVARSSDNAHKGQ